MWRRSTEARKRIVSERVRFRRPGSASNGGVAAEPHREIVRGHGDAASLGETVALGKLANVGEPPKPPTSVARAEGAIELLVRRCGDDVVFEERAVKHEETAGAKQRRRLLDEPLRDAPWGDMKEIDGHERAPRRVSKRVPVLRVQHVERRDRLEVVEPRVDAVRFDTGERFRIGLGRLPPKGREPPSEVNRVLTTSAGDFEYRTLFRKQVRENSGNGLRIAKRRR